jgi:hypothetical protein
MLPKQNKIKNFGGTSSNLIGEVSKSPNLGGGGRLEGRFFFQAVFGVDSGLSSVHLDMDFPCKFYLRGKEDLFSFQPIGTPKVPCFYSF